MENDRLGARLDLLLFAQCPRCAWPKFVREETGPIRCDNPHCRSEIERDEFQPYDRLTRPPALRV